MYNRALSNSNFIFWWNKYPNHWLLFVAVMLAPNNLHCDITLIFRLIFLWHCNWIFSQMKFDQLINKPSCLNAWLDLKSCSVIALLFWYNDNLNYQKRVCKKKQVALLELNWRHQLITTRKCRKCGFCDVSRDFVVMGNFWAHASYQILASFVNFH